MGTKSFKELIVWQKARDLAVAVYKLTEDFPRSELYGLADQMRRAAVYCLVSKKMSQGALKVIDSFEIKKAKTKELAYVLGKILKSDKNSKTFSALIVPAGRKKEIYRTSANIPKTKAVSSSSLNVSDLLKYRNVLIETEAIGEMKNNT